MNPLRTLRDRLRAALLTLTDGVEELADMVQPASDPRFGDYQANCAMPLGKRLGQPPRQVAERLVAALDVADLCDPPEVAGPGFINLRLRDDVLAEAARGASRDVARLGVAPVDRPRRYVVDFSSPNVAKPMHVGHIRSTVIGDAISRVLRFVGHMVVTDNHIGDWGTQFGMIIYGYKHLVDERALAAAPVDELSRLYKLVNRVADHQDALRTGRPALAERLAAAEARVAAALAEQGANPSDKQAAKRARQAEGQAAELRQELADLDAKLRAFAEDAVLSRIDADHPHIGRGALEETARLHAGDPENRALWERFLPACLEEIEKTYKRLDVTFDHALGESFYEEMLPEVVADLAARGLAVESDGALCVFTPGHEAPFIVRKRDGAFLYATTDLATIRYRMAEWRPDAVLYVVDHRQSQHFEQLFATARMWGYDAVELVHVSFGTVLGDDGKPYKTRSGAAVGLMGLLDEAVERAGAVAAQSAAITSEDERRTAAERIGIGAIKYADLAHNRTSDYVFSYDKMLAMQGNTAAYMQYSYARVRSIFARGDVDAEALRASDAAITLGAPAERALALALVRFGEALDRVVADYRPNHLTAHLYELACRYSEFFEVCPVLKAESDALRSSRLLLCDLTARTLERGLGLLGIQTVERM